MTSSGSGQVRASDVVAAQIRRLRAGRGLTAARLAERCQALGAPAITTNVITNIETRRRDVSVDDLLVFALALDVPPLHLLSPAPGDDKSTAPKRSGQQPSGPAAFAVTGTVAIPDPVLTRRWLHGQQALPGSQEHLYYAAAHDDATQAGTTTAPAQDAGARLAAQFDREAANFVSTVRAQVDGLLTGLETAVTKGDSPQDVLATLAQARSRLTSGQPSADADEHPGDASNS
jgi:hypothetical protein